MGNQKTEWIEIAKMVSKNPFIKVKCPNCDKVFLDILIIPWQGTESKVNIHLVCSKCKVRNIITKNVIEP